MATRAVVVLALARLLTPHELGLAAMVLVFSPVAHLFTDLTLGSALVQRRELVEAHRSTAFWTSACAGVVLALIGMAVAGPVADFYGEPRAEALFRAVSVLSVVTALATTQSALLTREMRFRAIELVAIVVACVGGATAVAVAAAGGGPWALVAQQAVAAGLTTSLLWIASGWRPRLLYSLEALRSLAGFSVNLIGTRLLFYLQRNADNILVGRFLGAGSLGAYAIAYNLVLLPFERIVDPIRTVVFPVFVRLQDERDGIADAWLRVTRLVVAVVVPLLLGLAVVAPDAVPLVLGSQWEPAVPVIQILSAVGVLQALASLNSVVLPAIDRTRTLLRFAVVAAVLSLAGFAAGLPFGIEGVAAGYLAANLVVVPLYSWLTARAIGLEIWSLAQAVRGALEAALAMLLVVAGARLLLVEWDVDPPARLALVIALGIATFVPLLALRAPEVIGDARRILRPKEAY
jgi:O-antigen/teichoic acid export membrane protein